MTTEKRNEGQRKAPAHDSCPVPWAWKREDTRLGNRPVVRDALGLPVAVVSCEPPSDAHDDRAADLIVSAANWQLRELHRLAEFRFDVAALAADGRTDDAALRAELMALLEKLTR